MSHPGDDVLELDPLARRHVDHPVDPKPCRRNVRRSLSFLGVQVGALGIALRRRASVGEQAVAVEPAVEQLALRRVAGHVEHELPPGPGYLRAELRLGPPADALTQPLLAVRGPPYQLARG